MIGDGAPARLRLRTGLFAHALTRVFGADAFTLGTRVFLSKIATREIAAETEAGRRLLRHELVHVSQFAREGIARFLWKYAASYARSRRRGLSHASAYLEVPYEREARAAETQTGSEA